MNTTYDPSTIEPKWQKIWEENQLDVTDILGAKKPFYNLMMFPYPSAEGLHVGNMYAFTASDIYGRFKKLQGNDVFEPIGLDGFGIHSENYALKIGRHPKDHAAMTEKNFYHQLHQIGAMFDWTRTVETYHPDYYRWTQWLFIQMFKRGLAYRGKSFVNFCPKDKTVLSDEQVINGKCERCGAEVEKREMEQWFFKITAYAERLLGNLDKLDWSAKVKATQKNWIGKKEGARITFSLKLSEKVKKFAEKDSADLPTYSADFRNCDHIEVFTTRPDTIFGATFIVLAPEHPLSLEIAKQNKEVSDYLVSVGARRAAPDSAEPLSKDKTGVPTGVEVINPATKTPIPVWISDYVLSDTGTGAIMGVPAHDERDFDFAKKFGLPIIEVVSSTKKSPRGDFQSKQLSDVMPAPSSKSITENNKFVKSMDPGGVEPPLPALKELAPHRSGPIPDSVYTGSGILVNSGPYSGLSTAEAANQIVSDLKKEDLADFAATYHLRDWLISRQRYWGAPIPMIFCPKCAREGKSYFSSSVIASEAKQSHNNNAISMRSPRPAFGGSRDDNTYMAGWYPVPEKDLPVLLPDITDYQPEGHGKGPLAKHPEFSKTTCPNCGGPADRETDVCDTFLDSSWYFLRYPSVGDDKEPFDPKVTKKWLPVDMYTGGAEHAVLHLMYSRFVTMVLHDIGFLDFDEPFTRFFAHGLLIKDGAKMSKSKGNVVNPDEYIVKYGADALRLYLMFMGPVSEGGDFRDAGMRGMRRFVDRLWRVVTSQIESLSSNPERHDSPEVAREINQLVAKTAADYEQRKYNLAISALMVFLNTIGSQPWSRETVEKFLIVLSPLAPYLSEELWQQAKKVLYLKSIILIKNWSVHQQSWPKSEEANLSSEKYTLVVSVNGKPRGTLELGTELAEVPTQEQVVKKAQTLDNVAKYLSGKAILKTVYVPGKILNFVVNE